MKAIILSSALFLFAIVASAQVGTLRGKVFDKSDKTLLSLVYVTVEANGNIVGADSTDLDGEYTIRPLPPGRYTVIAARVGYNEASVQDVIIKSDQTTYIDLKLPAIPIADTAAKKKKVRLKPVKQ